MKLALKEVDGIIGKVCTTCGKWKELVEYHNSNKGLGNRVSKCKKCLSVKKDKRIIWNRENIEDKLKELKDSNFDLSYRNVKKNYSGLLKACNRIFGSYKKCLDEIGISYSIYTKENRKLDRSILLEDLKKYINANGTAIGYSQKEYLNYKSIIYYFGSFKKALSEIGQSDSWFFYTDKETIVKEIKKISRNNIVTRKEIDKNLYHAACRYFGDFSKAAEACGLEYSRKIHNDWDEKKILDAIKNLEKKSYCIVENENESLVGAARRYFGSWENAIEKAGFSYEETREDKLTTNYCGEQFEKIIDELFLELGVNYNKYEHKRWNPDYVFNARKWGDAKLSEWSDKKNTIRNYEKNCGMLTIIFMRGKKDRDEMITKKTRIISVFNLIKQLPKSKRRFFLQKIETLETKLSQIELSTN